MRKTAQHRLRWEQRYTPQSGFATFSLLETIVVVVLVVILIVTAMENLLPLRGKAEQANVLSTIGALRSALGIAVAERAMRQGLGPVAELGGSNPMAQLAVKPANYLGEQAATDPAGIPPGHWVFDSDRRLLVYRVRYPQYFRGGAPDPVRIRFRVILRYTDHDADGRYSVRTDSLHSVELRALDDYAWQEPEGSEIFRLFGF